MHLSKDERVKLLEAIKLRVNKLKNKQNPEQLQQKENQDDPVDPEADSGAGDDATPPWLWWYLPTCDI